MPHLNVEIKARLRDRDFPGPEGHAGFIREYLNARGAEFRGTDEQTDTYFNVAAGRLKLREGKIENNLIYYERADREGPKSSEFTLVKVADPDGLKTVLSRSVGIKTIVRKTREIYYIGNVKFHIDKVPGLGSFTEIEAGNLVGNRSKEELQAQCEHYLKEFRIEPADLVPGSYSDMPDFSSFEDNGS